MSQDKQALIPIIIRYYEQIIGLEEPLGIRFREGDMRARIDYFHDAVRALTSGSDDPYARHSRLSVEHLAYDLSQLRLIQGNPAANMVRVNNYSASDQLLVPGGQPVPQRQGMDAATRRELAQHYKDYTVMFAALFAEVADNNFQARCEEVDSIVADMALIEQIMQQLASGRLTPAQAQAALGQVGDDRLRSEATKAVQGRAAEKVDFKQKLDQFEQRMGGERKQIEQAHLAYATGQLAVYEEARDTIKRLASQGLNLAGKFVENAMSAAQGRGQGRG